MGTGNLIRTLFVLASLTVSCFIGVDLFYLVVAEKIRPERTEEIREQTAQEAPPSVKPSLHQFKLISEKNIFGIAEKGIVPPPQKREAEEIVPTTLNLVLLGTGAVSDEESAVAVIRDTVQKKQDFYRVGDTVEGAVITKILRGRVIVRVGTRDEVLIMEKEPLSVGGTESPSPRPPADRSTVRLSRAQMEQSARSINHLLSQARVRPAFRDGKPDGLSITQVSNGSFFQRLGLTDGDVLRSVNGKPIQVQDDIVSLYHAVRSMPNVTLMILRGGRPRTMEYNLER
jgi:general secretion pathway protein C